MREDFNTGFFYDDKGNSYIKNEYDPEVPIFIKATTDIWECIANGQRHFCEWSALNAFPALSDSIKDVSAYKLINENSPGYLSNIRFMISSLLQAGKANQVDFNKDFSVVSSKKWLKIWNHMSTTSRSTFRSFYQVLSLEEMHGASYEFAQELESWNARNGVIHLKSVVMWNPTRGALTSLEWEQVRQYLESDIENESIHDYSIRIFCRILMETLKRPAQILKIRANGLVELEDDDGTPGEFFLRIPKSKAQTGDKPKLWQITKKLRKDIQVFSNHPEIEKRQAKYDLLFILTSKVNVDDLKWEEYGCISSTLIRRAVNAHFKTQSKILSHRTKKIINLSPYRIRHTGATALALQGFSRQEIQDVLEHDSPSSADAYINAVGSDLFPSIEKASDRGLGKIFNVLSDAYFFKGSVVEEIGDAPIVIPSLEIFDHNNIAPALVGSCGKGDVCNKHPFWGCYNGCEYFMAWRRFDHAISLEYVEMEFKRWSQAEGGKQRSKLSKDFDKVAASIREVIREIDEED